MIAEQVRRGAALLVLQAGVGQCSAEQHGVFFGPDLLQRDKLRLERDQRRPERAHASFARIADDGQPPGVQRHHSQRCIRVAGARRQQHAGRHAERRCTPETVKRGARRGQARSLTFAVAAV